MGSSEINIIIKTNITGKVIGVYKKCVYCQNEFNSLRGRGVGRAKKIKFCSRKCVARFRAQTIKGENHHCWKGGLKKEKGRYVSLRTYAGPGHRYTSKGVHRLVIEQHLGRELRKDEEVHHLNSNKWDNRLENLLLIPKAEHSRLHGKERGGINGRVQTV